MPASPIHPADGERIPDSRWFRQHCVRCGVPLRVTEGVANRINAWKRSYGNYGDNTPVDNAPDCAFCETCSPGLKALRCGNRHSSVMSDDHDSYGGWGHGVRVCEDNRGDG